MEGKEAEVATYTQLAHRGAVAWHLELGKAFRFRNELQLPPFDIYLIKIM